MISDQCTPQAAPREASKVPEPHCAVMCQVVDNAVKAVKYLKSLGCDDIEFSPEDAGRTEPHFLYRILEAVIKAGATTLNIPDTVRCLMVSMPLQQSSVLLFNRCSVRNRVRSYHGGKHCPSIPGTISTRTFWCFMQIIGKASSTSILKQANTGGKCSDLQLSSLPLCALKVISLDHAHVMM